MTEQSQSFSPLTIAALLFGDQDAERRMIFCLDMLYYGVVYAATERLIRDWGLE